MPKTTIWLNKGFSVNYHLLTSLVRAIESNHQPWQVIASHTHPHAPMLQARGQWNTQLEPKGLTGEVYLTWCLQFCQQHHVTVFVASKEKEFLALHTQTFQDQGVLLITTADASTLELLEDKVAFLNSFPEVLKVPAYEVFTTLEEFEQATLRLKALGHERLCFKPAKGIYASGFRVLTKRSNMDRLLSGDLYSMSYQEARAYFEGEHNFKPMLLMHYCGGTERSIDALAWKGQLLYAVVRSKSSDHTQHLEDRPDLVEAVRQLAAHYHLSGIFNVQTRDDAEQAHILEINARPSGGIHISQHAGVVFLYDLILAALEQSLNPQQPNTDIWVSTFSAGLQVEHHD